jgi:energy-coupling factor transport system ATP-binding protein
MYNNNFLIEFNIRNNKGNLILESSSISFYNNRPTLILMPSGSGRTILAELLADITPSQTDFIVKFNLKLQNEFDKETVGSTQSLLLNRALVPQNPFRYFLELTVKDEIISTLENADIEFFKAYDKVIEVSRDVGVEHLLDRNPLTLSGGEVQRIALAIALVREPEFLILDEPFGELDIEARDSLSQYLTINLPFSGIKVCLISSFASLNLLKLSNVYLVNQKIISKLDIFSWEIVNLLSYLRSHGIYIPNEHKNTYIFTEINFTNENKNSYPISKCLVEISKLTFRYSGQKKNALTEVSFRLYYGDRCAIMGPNGSGKSTLLSIILGFEKKAISSVNIYGQIGTNKKFAFLRSRTGIVFQTYHHYFFNSTPRCELHESLKKAKQNIDNGNEQILILGLNIYEPIFFIEEIAKRFGLFEVLDEIVDNLTVQQRRLLAISCAIIEAMDLLVLDEPTAGMDNFGREIILKELRFLNDQRLAIIIISHDIEFLNYFCNRFIELKDGKVIHDSFINSIHEENN